MKDQTLPSQEACLLAPALRSWRRSTMDLVMMSQMQGEPPPTRFSSLNPPSPLPRLPPSLTHPPPPTSTRRTLPPVTRQDQEPMPPPIRFLHRPPMWAVVTRWAIPVEACLTSHMPLPLPPPTSTTPSACPSLAPLR